MPPGCGILINRVARDRIGLGGHGGLCSSHLPCKVTTNPCRVLGVGDDLKVCVTKTEQQESTSLAID